jgi:hypothetical protein
MRAMEKARPPGTRRASRQCEATENLTSCVLYHRNPNKSSNKQDTRLTNSVRSLAVILAPSIETARRNHWPEIVSALTALCKRERRRGRA